jgi:hypothetical protein
MTGHRSPVGAAIAWRGPMGFNFSFLENRCDVLVEPDLPDDQAGLVAQALVSASMPTYEDFPPGWMPLVTAPRHVPLYQALGARPIRPYAQATWLASGYAAMFARIDGARSSQ